MKNYNSKFKILIILIFFLLFSSLFLLARRKKEPQKEIKKEQASSVIFIDKLPESERPVVLLSSRPDGKELTLEVSNLQNIRVVEYELIYFAEGSRPGLIGTINLKSGEDSLSRKLLLGTCSSGVCRYDKNVTAGTLIITFRNQKTYKFVKDFALEKEKGKTTVVME